MGNPKISGFLIGIAVVAFISGIFALGLTSFSAEYPDMNFGGDENQSIQTYNKMNDLTEQVNETSSQLQNIGQDDLELKDILGGIFNSGYNALKTVAKSIGLFYNIEEQGFKDANLGAPGVLLKSLIVVIVLVLIFIGVIMSAILKKDV